MKRAYDGSDSSMGNSVSSSFTRRRRKAWNVSYHSRSQCVCGTIATVMGGRLLISSSSHGEIEVRSSRLVGRYPWRMPMYAMLSTLGPDGWETLRQHPERILAVKAEVEAMGLKVHAQYALMGQYDFLNMIEAPDAQSMAKAAITLAARGTMRTTTLPAIPVEDLIARLSE